MRAAAARITAKNGLKSYTYNFHDSLTDEITDEKLADKFNTVCFFSIYIYTLLIII
jgi:hypothetical protein